MKDADCIIKIKKENNNYSFSVKNNGEYRLIAIKTKKEIESIFQEINNEMISYIFGNPDYDYKKYFEGEYDLGTMWIKEIGKKPTPSKMISEEKKLPTEVMDYKCEYHFFASLNKIIKKILFLNCYNMLGKPYYRIQHSVESSIYLSKLGYKIPRFVERIKKLGD
jgi:hypothetical protein